MRRLTATPSIVIFIFATVSALASDPVTGVWTGFYWNRAMDTSMRNPIALELELKGDEIQGVLLGGEVRLPIENGRYGKEERKIHFEVFFPGNQLRYIADGIVADDEIKGTWRHEKADGTFELRREKQETARREPELLHSAEVWRFYSETLERDLRFRTYLKIV